MTGRISDDHAIGVGMGGSCPECNAPVDLGQEFCLECGAPISGARKRRRRKAPPGTPAAVAALDDSGKRRNFPWVPFFVVLTLLILGVVLTAMASQGDSDTASKNSDEAPPTLSTLETQQSTTPTVTVQDCLTAGGVAGAATTTPTATTPGTTGADGVTTYGTPGLSTTPSTVPSTPTVPTTYSTPTATTPGASGTSPTTVTVDQNGNLCPAAATTPTVPTTPTTTATTDTTGATTGAGSGTDSVSKLDWPAGKSGYTVVIASFSQRNYSESDAQIRATQAQSRGLSSGVLDSNGFSSLTPNLYVVFSGIFDTEAEAESHQQKVRSAGYQGAYTRNVSP